MTGNSGPAPQVTVARKRGRRRQQTMPDQPNGLDRVFVWDIDGSLVRSDTITDSPDSLEPSVLASVTDKLGSLAKRLKELTLTFCDEHLFLSELESSDQMHIDDVPSDQELAAKRAVEEQNNNNCSNNNNNNSNNNNNNNNNTSINDNNDNNNNNTNSIHNHHHHQHQQQAQTQLSIMQDERPTTSISSTTTTANNNLFEHQDQHQHQHQPTAYYNSNNHHNATHLLHHHNQHLPHQHQLQHQFHHHLPHQQQSEQTSQVETNGTLASMQSPYLNATEPTIEPLYSGTDQEGFHQLTGGPETHYQDMEPSGQQQQQQQQQHQHTSHGHLHMAAAYNYNQLHNQHQHSLQHSDHQHQFHGTTSSLAASAADVHQHLAQHQHQQSQEAQSTMIQDDRPLTSNSSLFESSEQPTLYYNHHHHSTSHHHQFHQQQHHHHQSHLSLNHQHHQQQQQLDQAQQNEATSVGSAYQLPSNAEPAIEAYGMYGITTEESFHQLAASAPTTDAHYSESLWAAETNGAQHHSSHGHLHMAAAYNYTNQLHQHQHHHSDHQHHFHAASLAAAAAADVHHLSQQHPQNPHHHNHHLHHHHHHHHHHQSLHSHSHLSHQSAQAHLQQQQQLPHLVHHHHQPHHDHQHHQPTPAQDLVPHLHSQQSQHHHHLENLHQPLALPALPEPELHHSQQPPQTTLDEHNQNTHNQLVICKVENSGANYKQQIIATTTTTSTTAVNSCPAPTPITTTTTATTTTTTTTATLRTVFNNHHKQLTHKLSMRFHRIKTVYNLNRTGFKGDTRSSGDLVEILAEIDHYTLDWRKRAMDCLRLISESPNCTNIIVTKLPLVIAFGHLVCLGLSQYFEVDQVYSASKTNKEACIKRIKKRFGATNRCSYIIVGDREDVEMSKKLDLPSWPLSRSDGHRQLSQLHTALKDGYLM